MAKKTHIKVRLVPEAKPDSPYFYYVKKPAGGEKAKVKLKARKYNPSTRKHEIFVEKKFKQIKPKLFNSNRRYYDQNSIYVLQKIKYLLKEQGMTIDGVKKMLKKNNSLKLDDLSNKPINVPDNNLKIKLSKISKIIKDLKDLK